MIFAYLFIGFWLGGVGAFLAYSSLLGVRVLAALMISTAGGLIGAGFSLMGQAYADRDNNESQ